MTTRPEPKPEQPPAPATQTPPRALTAPARIQRPYLRSGEAADLIGVSIRTLEKYRCIGDGPPFLKIGTRVLYARQDVENWLQRHRCNSTSDENFVAALRNRASWRNRS
ncbi:helix-turn-helix domain-containing protein [Gluconobacter sp. OJB]|uniref:helix-turn-helix transcriptional regulator n=1 Tax=Gluconobacter sp. OJB TaxID=3145196 RepID=UPI0031F932FB